MKYLQSLHTHNTFCDGKNTIREMIEGAIALSFDSIGISSHAYTGYPFDVCGIKKEEEENYFNTVLSLKKEYEGRINVFLGLELESRINGEKRPQIDKRLDYTIGSVHIFRTPNGFYSVDNTPEEWKKALLAFNNDTLALIENYLIELTSFCEEVPFTILGHFDLYTKFNEKENLFDTKEPLYRSLALKYLDKIISTDKIIEVNTGAMSRGWRTTPYPELFLLEHMKKRNVRVTLSSDSHYVSTLDYGYEKAIKLLKEAGYTKLSFLTPKGWKECKL